VNHPPIHILLIEDNPGDVLLTREALTECALAHELSVVRDGEEALAFLERTPPHEAARRPDLVLLDLNLPRCDGKQVLGAIKSSPALKSIPVVVLTSSAYPEDIRTAYDLHANCYLTKPTGLEPFFRMIESLRDFWFNWATMPPTESKSASPHERPPS